MASSDGFLSPTKKCGLPAVKIEFFFSTLDAHGNQKRHETWEFVKIRPPGIVSIDLLVDETWPRTMPQVCTWRFPEIPVGSQILWVFARVAGAWWHPQGLRVKTQSWCDIPDLGFAVKTAMSQRDPLFVSE